MPRTSKEIFKKVAKKQSKQFLKGVDKPGIITILRAFSFVKKMQKNGIPMKTVLTLIPLLRTLPKQHRKLVVLMLLETVGVHPLINKKVMEAVNKLNL